MTSVVLLLLFIWADSPAHSDTPLELVLKGATSTELAPHGEGNVYAPDVHIEGDRYRMWYGGQGKDGHDRIHLAESHDGRHWDCKGVVLMDRQANHVNDPSVVRVGDMYFMFYTRAARGIFDEIALATSKDGIRWERKGVMLHRGSPGEWDSLLVGRPSVIHEGGQFKMWYDGRKDLQPGALAEDAPTSSGSHRFVGYATSKDGTVWTKYGRNPVFAHDAGGVDVKRLPQGYVMLYESHEGTNVAVSVDGITWRDRGLWIPRSGGEIDRHGHVTPMLLIEQGGRPALLFIGAARTSSWDRNQIVKIRLEPARLTELFSGR
ncbi:MAG TPA: hypothetical protein VKA15_01425 [Isosphaeraceae bacterium]|nr:hypothetical protein [Isosphaeraceae bacterium]